MPETGAASLTHSLWSPLRSVRGMPRLPHIALLLVAIAAVAACSPLPGNTIDPVYGRFRPRSEPQPAPSEEESTPRPRAETRAAKPSVEISDGDWAGRYVDSRGAGTILLSLVRRGAVITGTWRLRTGGGGPLSGTIADDGRIAFRMESTAPACPGKFEGWAEIHDTTLVGAYHGQDCEGVVADGRIDAQRK